MMVNRRLHIKMAQLLFPILFRPNLRTDMVRLGSEYGGWWIPVTGIGSDSICYLAGVGTDISFDQALIERTNCHAWGFDPTPKALDWFNQSVGHLDNYTLLPFGFAGKSGELKFYAPANPDHVSHSTKNLQHTDSFFTARVKTIGDAMLALEHENLTLVKLDIEGAEHDTIKVMLADGIRPAVICVEFDQPEPFGWALRTVRLLKAAGYGIAMIEQFNFTFVRNQHFRPAPAGLGEVV